MRARFETTVRLMAILLLAAIVCAPALGRDRCADPSHSSEEQQDPWEEEKPVEIEKDAFEKELTLDPIDLVCPTVIPTTTCLFNEGVTTAHFLEASLYVLRHLRI